MRDLYRTIVRPVVTEKSSAQHGALKEYAFEVRSDATKQEIRAAVERLFGVHVVRVRTMVQRARRASMGRSVGRLPAWKKALVRLREGDAIEGVFEG
jgi:large subunit ribosomal protein L23